MTGSRACAEVLNLKGHSMMDAGEVGAKDPDWIFGAGGGCDGDGGVGQCQILKGLSKMGFDEDW